MARYASVQRQQAEEARHRVEILEAAVRVFAERGLHAATMRDVAKAAAFSVGKLYLHFPSKDALYQALLEHYIDRIVDVVGQTLSAPGRPRERIENMVRTCVAFLEQDPLAIRLFLNETLGFALRLDAHFGKSFAVKYTRMMARVRQTFEHGLAVGDFCGESGEELAVKFSGIFNAVLAAELGKPHPPSPLDVAERVLRLFYKSPLPDTPKTKSAVRARLLRKSLTARGSQ